MRRHRGLTTTPLASRHTRHPDEPPPRPARATPGHTPRHPPTPGRQGGHPTPRGGHHHHRVNRPHTNEHHGPVRSPSRCKPLGPSIAGATRFRGLRPRLRHERRADDADTKGQGIHGLPKATPRTRPTGARNSQRRRHNAGGAHPLGRRLGTTHHPAARAQRTDGHKQGTRTIQRHHTPWTIPKRNAPATDVPSVKYNDQGALNTC